MGGQVVRGEPVIALRHLGGLPVLPDLVDRAPVGQPGLLFGAGRTRFPAPDAAAQDEGADEQRHDDHTGDEQPDGERAPCCGDVHPSGVHGARVPLVPLMNPFIAIGRHAGEQGLVPTAPATRLV